MTDSNLLLIFSWIVATQMTYNFIMSFFTVVDREIEQRIKDRVNELLHRLKIEKHNGVMYWFDADDDRFLAQGADTQDIIATLKVRFPDHMFYLERPGNEKDKLLSARTEWKFVDYDIKHVNLEI
jgi:hypothetical protein